MTSPSSPNIFLFTCSLQLAYHLYNRNNDQLLFITESLVHEPYRIVRSVLFAGMLSPSPPVLFLNNPPPPRSNSIQLDQLEERIVGASGEFFSAVGRATLGEESASLIKNTPWARIPSCRSQHLVIRY